MRTGCTLLCMVQTLGQWMKAKRLDDAEVASRLGGVISRSQVSRIRRGKSIPPPATAEALAKLTGIAAGRFALGLAAEPAAPRQEAA